MRQPVPLTLVSGGSYLQREAAILQALQQSPSDMHAVILEGLPDGNALLSASPQLSLQRIAPGCFCCIGNLPMRVSLNRALRLPVQRLYLGIASSAHLEAIRVALETPPYHELLLADSSICL